MYLKTKKLTIFFAISLYMQDKKRRNLCRILSILRQQILLIEKDENFDFSGNPSLLFISYNQKLLFHK